ncbi:hypothetical protein HK100_007342 [Physocladia obscura]|uniref:Uncharacterized protein n=1 Tax=Physocladia obscura TaxID=109957 RepID=A0AAD5XAV3_9FUNG|nr:hypothetical protein HK100_007342 [Physocladia obscura]
MPTNTNMLGQMEIPTELLAIRLAETFEQYDLKLSVFEASLPTVIPFSNSKQYFETMAWIRLLRGVNLICSPNDGKNNNDSKFEHGIRWILLSLDYVPQSYLDSLAENKPIIPSHMHRLSRLVHTLLPILCSYKISFPGPIHHVHPVTSDLYSMDKICSPSSQIPAFYALNYKNAVEALENDRPLANLNRLLKVCCSDGVNIWRIASCGLDLSGFADEASDLQWMIVLATWHLYTGKIRIWLTKIFPRMQYKPAGNSIDISQLKTSRRMIPTIQDVETFLIFLVAQNYVKCTASGKAKDISHVLRLTIFKQCWIPSLRMVAFWKSLLAGYSDQKPDDLIEQTVTPSITKYLRDIRFAELGSLENIPYALLGIYTHVATIYSELAVSGTEDCRIIASSMVAAALKIHPYNTETEQNSPKEGFFADILTELNSISNLTNLLKICEIYKLALTVLVSPVSPARVPTSPARTTNYTFQNTEVQDVSNLLFSDSILHSHIFSPSPRPTPVKQIAKGKLQTSVSRQKPSLFASTPKTPTTFRFDTVEYAVVTTPPVKQLEDLITETSKNYKKYENERMSRALSASDMNVGTTGAEGVIGTGNDIDGDDGNEEIPGRSSTTSRLSDLRVWKYGLFGGQQSGVKRDNLMDVPLPVGETGVISQFLGMDEEYVLWSDSEEFDVPGSGEFGERVDLGDDEFYGAFGSVEEGVWNDSLFGFGSDNWRGVGRKERLLSKMKL